MTLFLASFQSIVSAGNGGGEHIVAHYIERESLIFVNARVLLKRVQVDENGPNKVEHHPSGHLHRRRKLRGEFFSQFVHETAQQAPFKGSLVNEHRRTFQFFKRTYFSVKLHELINPKDHSLKGVDWVVWGSGGGGAIREEVI